MSAAVVGAAQGASTPTPNTGDATTAVSLPHLSVTLPDGSVREVALGSLTASAATVDTAKAALGFAGGKVLGTSLSSWGVDSGSGSQSGDHSVPISAAAISGALDLLGYSVSAAPGAATAKLGALSGDLSVAPLGAQVDLGQHGITSDVSRSLSTSALSLTAAGGSLDLGDLLPANVLSALPLSELVQLLHSLGLPLPAGATDALSKLADLTSLLGQIKATAGQLSTAQTSLATLLSSLPSTATAQQTLTSAQATLTAALAALQTAQDQLANDAAVVQGLQQQVNTLVAQVAADQTALNDANNTVTSLTNQIATTVDPVTLLNLQQQLATANQDVTAKTAQLAQDQTTLTNAQNQLAQAQAAVTSDNQVVTTVTQQADSAQQAVAVAQQALDALVATVTSTNVSVADAQQLVTQLTNTLTSLLPTLSAAIGALPDLNALRDSLLATLTGIPLVDLGHVGVSVESIANDASGQGSVGCTLQGATVLTTALPSGTCGDAVGSFGSAESALHGVLAKLPVAAGVPTPTLDGLAASSHGSTPTSADTVTRADAALSPLHLGLPSVTLAAVTDPVLAALKSALTQAQQSLSGLGLPSLTSTLTQTLGQLTQAVGSLPSGSALAGLRTLGVDLSLVGVTTSVLHYRTAKATPAMPTGTSATPVTAHTPSTPTGTDGSLPFTGDNSTIELAIGVLAMLAGAHLMLVGRRRTG